jgi:hypothetical protein
MVSRFAPLFQLQVPTSTALYFYLETVAKGKLALSTVKVSEVKGCESECRGRNESE